MYQIYLNISIAPSSSPCHMGINLNRLCSGSDLITGNYKDYSRSIETEEEVELKTESGGSIVSISIVI